MSKKKKSVRKWNCKNGLTSKQEHLARGIREDLLDDNKKVKHYEELRNLWRIFIKENKDNLNVYEFGDYVGVIKPELYSAFKRLDIDITGYAINNF